MRPELKYIGKEITIKAIRDYILDAGLTESNTVLLNSQNFDDIVLEHLDFYRESIDIPYHIVGILVSEDKSAKIPLNRIGIITGSYFEYQNFVYEKSFDLYDGENAYRCGYCGSIVDQDGNELFDEERNRIIKYIQNFEGAIVIKAHGKCCKNKW